MRVKDVFDRHWTDKGVNGYADLYEALFKCVRDKVNNVLEVGIGTQIPNVLSTMAGYAPGHYAPGASLRAWREYFSSACIYGIDVQEDTIITSERIITAICDSTNEASVTATVGGWGVLFDVIIDDGNHEKECQLQTLRNLWKYVVDGGYYIVEDIQPWSEFKREYRKEISEIVGDSSMFMTETKQVIVISKPEESGG